MLEFLVGIPAFVIFLIGIFALMGKGGLGGYAKAITGAIPFGSQKLWAIIFVAVGLIFGAFSGASALWGKVGGSVSEASFGAQNQPSVSQLSSVNCELSDISLSTAIGFANASVRSDKNDLSHYYIDVENATDSVDDGINGTLSCTRSGSLVEGAGIECHVEAEKYLSETSSTDSAEYYIIAKGTSASKVPGYDWAQTAYLNDNGVATTSSNSEKTILTYDDNEAIEELGYYLTLPGVTAINALDAQSSRDVRIVCGNSVAYRFTITKIATA